MNSSVRASVSASESTCKAGQLAAASGVGLVKQESCEHNLLIHNQNLESCQEEERQDELLMHSAARTYDKHPNVRHSYSILTPAGSKFTSMQMQQQRTVQRRSTMSRDSAGDPYEASHVHGKVDCVTLLQKCEHDDEQTGAFLRSH